MPSELVEIGFDLALPTGPYLVLDDPTKGKLDTAGNGLAGFQYYDVTNYVTAISVNRGKADYIDNISAGELVVELNNRTRAFDPLYASSPYYGQIIPKRVVRYSSNGIQQAQMVIDDWNLEYTPDGDAKASFTASDGFVYLNNQTLALGTATVQDSGARVSAVLSDQYVQWPTADRIIDTGSATLGANVVPDGENALAYIQQIERTEQGLFFIDKTGNAVFQSKLHAPTTSLTKFADDGTGIKYQNLQIAYGSENLINEVDATSVITTSQISGIDAASQLEFGIFNITYDDLLHSTNAQVTTFVTEILAKYSRPQYRFTELTVRLNSLSLSDQNKILGAELGDFVEVVFTPSNLPPAIDKFAKVIRISQSVDITGEHLITFGLDTLNFTYLVLDDTVFGKLDTGALA